MLHAQKTHWMLRKMERTNQFWKAWVGTKGDAARQQKKLSKGYRLSI
jgi:hypothetical protein